MPKKINLPLWQTHAQAMSPKSLDDEMKANRLRQAAPAMLNALELITSWYDDQDADTDKFDDLIELAKQVIQEARS